MNSEKGSKNKKEKAWLNYSKNPSLIFLSPSRSPTNRLKSPKERQRGDRVSVCVKKRASWRHFLLALSAPFKGSFSPFFSSQFLIKRNLLLYVIDCLNYISNVRVSQS
uniref:Uncharacterized protein n=1 Tax=Opuntia streptacantha TaxID=393608 RepID=A0A7C9DWK5_OPUST